MNSEFSPVPTDDRNEKEKMVLLDAPFYLRKRYYVIFLLFVGYIMMTLLRINLNISIVDLTSNKTKIVGNSTQFQKAEYDWTPPQKGLLLSAVSFGYVASPVGAIIANKFGGIRTYGVTVLLTGCLTILSPLFIQWNVYVFFLIRIMEGLLQGFSFAAAFTSFAKWVPPAERARLVNFTLLGATVGGAINFPIVGFINHYFTWQYVFYITGGAAMLWYWLLYWTVNNSPLDDKIITKKEKIYFKNVCQQVAQDEVTIPWKSLFTSVPLLAYWNDRFVDAWSESFFFTCLPLYINDIYPANIKDIGILSGIPHFFATLSIIAFSLLSDHLRSDENRNKTRLHKTFILIGQVPGACLLIIVGFWGNFVYAMAAFSVFKICFSAAYVSYYILPLDMSLQHANVLIATGMAFKGIAAIINPIVMGFMVQNHLPQEWSWYFWFLSIFNFWGAIIFAVYGSGEIQPWASSCKNQRKELDNAP